MSTLVEAVTKLVDGGDLRDSTGRNLKANEAFGLTVEVNGDSHFFRAPGPFCDPNMEAMMKFTSMENQLARIEKTKGEAKK